MADDGITLANSRRPVRRSATVGAAVISPHGAFFGRDRELGLLRAAFDHAAAGRGRLVTITGEPGIGKTRLAQELVLRAEADGAVGRWARGHDGASAPPLRWWVQIVRAQSGDAATALLDDLVRAGAEPPDSAERFRLFDAVTTAICQDAAQRPVVLVLDDLQWADELSLQLLQFLTREIPTARVLVLATYRDAEIRVAPVLGDLLARGERIRLQGLDAAAVAALIADRLGDAPDPALVRAVLAESKGNPFFVRELLGGAAAPGAPLRIPALLRDVVRRRLAPLSTEARGGLSAAAVIGREFDAATLARILSVGREAVLGWLDEAIAVELVHLVPESVARYRFAHGLVHDTCLAELSTSERARLHRRAGEALEAAAGALTDAHVQTLADHFFEAAVLGDPEKAVRYAEEAGTRALQRYAYDDAARAFDRGLRAQALAAPDEVARLRLSLRWANARWRAGDATARDLLREIAELARHVDPVLFGEAALASALEVVEPEHTHPGTIAALEAGLRIVPDDAPGLRARLMAVLSIRLSTGAEFDPRAAALGVEALALARERGDDQSLGGALIARHLAMRHPHDLDARTGVGRELLDVCQRGDRMLATLQAHVLQTLDRTAHGDLAGADRAVDALWRGAEIACVPLFRWYARVQRAMRAIAAGRLDEGETLARAALALIPQGAEGAAPETLLTQLFAIRREQGRLVELLEPIARAPSTGRWGRLWQVRRALLRLDLGDTDAARRGLDALAGGNFDDVPSDAQWLPTLVLSAELVAGLGDVARAGTLYERLAPFASQAAVVGSAVLCLGSVHHPLGLLAATLGNLGDAVDHLDAAARAHRRMDAALLAVQSATALAAVLARRDAPGDRRRAQEEADGANALAARLRLKRSLPDPTAAGARSPASLRRAPETVAEFRRADGGWRVGLGERTHVFRDAKGFRYLARLIASPGRALSARDLLTGADAAGREEPRHAAPDPAAWSDVRAELAEAEAHHDLGRIAGLRAELEAALLPPSHVATTDAEAAVEERARVNVTKRIHVAIQQIAAVDPSLARYLDTTVRTGAACRYTPDPGFPIRWKR